MPISMANLRLSMDTALYQLKKPKTYAPNTSTTPRTPANLREQYTYLRRNILNNEDASTQFLFLPAQLHTSPYKTTLANAMAVKSAENYISVMIQHSHPFSRGSAHIASGSIDDKPTYDSAYLSHPLDLEIMACQIQFIERIVTTGPFSSLLKAGNRIPRNAHGLDNIDHAKEIVKDRLYHSFHPIGTCAMLPGRLGVWLIPRS